MFTKLKAVSWATLIALLFASLASLALGSGLLLTGACLWGWAVVVAVLSLRDMQ